MNKLNWSGKVTNGGVFERMGGNRAFLNYILPWKAGILNIKPAGKTRKR